MCHIIWHRANNYTESLTAHRVASYLPVIQNNYPQRGPIGCFLPVVLACFTSGKLHSQLEYATTSSTLYSLSNRPDYVTRWFCTQQLSIGLQSGGRNSSHGRLLESFVILYARLLTEFEKGLFDRHEAIRHSFHEKNMPKSGFMSDGPERLKTGRWRSFGEARLA